MLAADGERGETGSDAMATYAIIAEWTGPQNPAGDWTRLQHCEHVRSQKKQMPDWLQRVDDMGQIIFTDGTSLLLSVRDITGVRGKDRPPHQPDSGYKQLIRQCLHHGTNKVEELP